MALCALSLSLGRIAGRSGLAAESFQRRKQILQTRSVWIAHHPAMVQAIRTAVHYQPRIYTRPFSREVASLDCNIAIPSRPLTLTKGVHRLMVRRVIHWLAIKSGASTFLAAALGFMVLAKNSWEPSV